MSNQPYIKPLRILSIFGIILAASLLNGCGDIALFNPKGQIGLEEKNLIITSASVMLIVVIPVILMSIIFAWKYRASNTTAKYTPNWEHSTKIEIVVWAIPCIIILALSYITWQTCHSLDPSKPIASNNKPIVIDVVALDWKWLFIYPEQGIATVNEIAFPVDTPVEFHITSATVMNSFFIPQLGSQIYAMAGMDNKLHLIANETGVYKGYSANYSGAGFSDMKFNAIASTPAEFDAWVKKAKQSTATLNATSFNTLVEASKKNPVAYYSAFTPNIFMQIMQTSVSSKDEYVKLSDSTHPKTLASSTVMDMASSHDDMHMSPAH